MPKQTIIQFGQTIKAKHPEYADMDDATVGQKVLAKFPQYSDMVDSSPEASAPSLPAHPAVDIQPDTLHERVQRSFDQNTQRSPSDPLLETGLKSAVHGAGSLFVHPVQAAKGLIDQISSPIGPAAQTVLDTVSGVRDDYRAGGAGYATTKLAGEAFGGIAGGTVAGELGGATLRAGAEPAATAVNAAGRAARRTGSLASRVAVGAPAPSEALGADAGSALSRNRIVGTSPRSLRAKVSSRIAPAVEARDAILARSTAAPTDISEVVHGAYDDIAVPKTDPKTGAVRPAGIRQMAGLRDAITHVQDPDTGAIGVPKDSNLTPTELGRLQTNVYDLADYDTPESDLANQFVKGAGAGLKDRLNEVAPEATTMTDSLHDLLGAKDHLTRTQGPPPAATDLGPGKVLGKLYDRARVGGGTAVGAGMDMIGSGLEKTSGLMRRMRGGSSSPVAPVSTGTPPPPTPPRGLPSATQGVDPNFPATSTDPAPTSPVAPGTQGSMDGRTYPRPMTPPPPMTPRGLLPDSAGIATNKPVEDVREGDISLTKPLTVYKGVPDEYEQSVDEHGIDPKFADGRGPAPQVHGSVYPESANEYTSRRSDVDTTGKKKSLVYKTTLPEKSVVGRYSNGEVANAGAFTDPSDYSDRPVGIVGFRSRVPPALLEKMNGRDIWGDYDHPGKPDSANATTRIGPEMRSMPPSGRRLIASPDGTVRPEAPGLPAPAKPNLLESRTGDRAPSARPSLISRLKMEAEQAAIYRERQVEEGKRKLEETPEARNPIAPEMIDREGSYIVSGGKKVPLSERITPKTAPAPASVPTHLPAPDDIDGWESLVDEGHAEYDTRTHSYRYTGPVKSTKLSEKMKGKSSNANEEEYEPKEGESASIRQSPRTSGYRRGDGDDWRIIQEFRKSDPDYQAATQRNRDAWNRPNPGIENRQAFDERTREISETQAKFLAMERDHLAQRAMERNATHYPIPDGLNIDPRAVVTGDHSTIAPVDMYHGTKRSLLQNIKQEGIKPTVDSSSINDEAGAYLSPNRDYASAYAHIRARGIPDEFSPRDMKRKLSDHPSLVTVRVPPRTLLRNDVDSFLTPNQGAKGSVYSPHGFSAESIIGEEELPHVESVDELRKLRDPDYKPRKLSSKVKVK